MAEVWKPQPKEVLEHWLNTIVDEAEEKLTQWEWDFTNSLSEQLTKYGKLSQKQQEILEKIYVKYTS